MDTIFALASAPGKAGVAVIRVSGPSAWRAAEQLAGALPKPREAVLRRLKDRAGQVLDEALVLLFAKGASFTGEAVAEFHVHGSVAIQRAVLRELEEMDGLRMAEAGEFTRRALENDRLDLTQVEALADLHGATRAPRVRAGTVAPEKEDTNRPGPVRPGPLDVRQRVLDVQRAVRFDLLNRMLGRAAKPCEPDARGEDGDDNLVHDSVRDVTQVSGLMVERAARLPSFSLSILLSI